MFDLYQDIKFTWVDFGDDPRQSWQDVANDTKGWLSQTGITLLRKGLDDVIRGVLVERPYTCKDFESLAAEFYVHKFRDREMTCSRLHFFDQPVGRDAVLSGQASDHYIGFCVVEPLAERCIGRTIIDPTRLNLDASPMHTIAAKYTAHIGSASYDVWGYPYRSQSNEATVCAHTVLWSVCRHLSRRSLRYAERLPHELIRAADPRDGRPFPRRGLRQEDFCSILEGFGSDTIRIRRGDPVFSNTDGTQPPESRESNEDWFDRNLYAYVESGLPVIAGLDGHVVSVIGHAATSHDPLSDPGSQDTTNDGSELPTGQTQQGLSIVNACDALADYVVVDDQQFPYATMSTRRGSPSTRDALTIEKIQYLTVPLPRGVFLEPFDVRTFCNELIRQSLTDQNRVGQFGLREQPLIYRQFLTSSRAWKQKRISGLGPRKENIDGTNQFKDDSEFGTLYSELNLPRFVWVTEYARPSDRSDGFALGEIVLDATSGETDLFPVFGRFGKFRAEFQPSRNNATAKRINLLSTFNNTLFSEFRHNLGPHNE